MNVQVLLYLHPYASTSQEQCNRMSPSQEFTFLDLSKLTFFGWSIIVLGWERVLYGTCQPTVVDKRVVWKSCGKGPTISRCVAQITVTTRGFELVSCVMIRRVQMVSVRDSQGRSSYKNLGGAMHARLGGALKFSAEENCLGEFSYKLPLSFPR